MDFDLYEAWLVFLGLVAFVLVYYGVRAARWRPEIENYQSPKITDNVKRCQPRRP